MARKEFSTQTKKEAGDFITFIEVWGAQNGIVFAEKDEAA